VSAALNMTYESQPLAPTGNTCSNLSKRTRAILGHDGVNAGALNSEPQQSRFGTSSPHIRISGWVSSQHRRRRG